MAPPWPRRLLLLSLLIPACSPWDMAVPFTKNLPPPKVDEAIVAHRELTFARRPERDLHLDIYRPRGAPSPTPTVLYVFGGGYFMGSRHSVAQEGAIWPLLDQGIAIATIDYRYSSEALFPAQIHDVTAAICWLRRHAGDYALDPSRFALAGQSAGGHLATLAGVGADDAALQDPSCEGVGSQVTAVIDYFGPTDYASLSPADSILYDRMEDLFGGPFAQHPEEVALSSVLARVSADDPALFIAHGTADELVPPSQSERLYAASQALGHRSELRLLEGEGHGGEAFMTAEFCKDIKDFLEESWDE